MSKNKSDFMNAANKAPSERSSAERALVSEAHKRGMTDVKNADHATQQRVRTYGH